MKLSVVILSKNEEDNIGKAIGSVKDIADEIVVIDDESADETVLRAKKAGARVISKKLESFAEQRNAGDGHVKGEWILHLDADEVVTEDLRREIRNRVQRDDYTAYFIKRRDFYRGKEIRYGEVGTARHIGFIRLYRKGSGAWSGTVHEHFVTDGKTGSSNACIDHHSHASVTDFLNKINYYSTMRARELKNSGKRATVISLTLQPVAKFLYTYFIKVGFLDGPEGFIYAFMMSFHSFLVRAKLYQFTKLEK